MESVGNLIERLIPADALPTLFRLCVWGDSRPRPSMRSEAPLPRNTLGRNPAHRMQHAVRRIHAVQILRHLRTQKSARHRMLGIALDPGRLAILNRDPHAASIGTIVRTRGMDNPFRHRSIIKCSFHNPDRKKSA
jgi:hypothetical protein